MDCSMPGFPVLHHLPELAQTHVHQTDNAIQPSHPLLTLLPLPSIFPSIRVFSIESALPIKCPKYWSFRFSISLFNEYSVLFSFRTDVTIKRVTDHLNRKLVRKRGCGKNTNNKLFYEAPYSPPPPLYVWSILTSFAAPSETQEEGRNMQPGES